MADVVLANILAAPLISLAPLLTGLLKPGGRLALSGILEEQAPSVRAAYSPVMEPLSIRQKDEWVLLQGRRSVSHDSVPGVHQ
jgi:ribosomal protein L11 methyltransferase